MKHHTHFAMLESQPLLHHPSCIYDENIYHIQCINPMLYCFHILSFYYWLVADFGHGLSLQFGIKSSYNQIEIQSVDKECVDRTLHCLAT